MNNMAFRSLSKINSNALQNSRRLFSFKFEMTPRVAQESTSSTAEAEAAPAAEEQTQQQPTSNFRYNVCQPRTSPVQRLTSTGDILAAKKQIVQNTIEQQHLQPSMLPQYYEKKMDNTPFINTARDDKDKSVSQRRFQVSSTHANATFPLKSVKLANPFPEPVKMMMSRTVSDEEKAEQMLADSRSQRNFSDWGNNKAGLPNQRNLSSGTRRWFSSKTVDSNPDKCKKLKKEKKSGCPKMHMPHCPPPARQKCAREPRDIDCKKQEAPYPAYSEFCHEDVEEKPSECKMCFWSPEDNPNFKPQKNQKKKFHTSAAAAFKRTGLETEKGFTKSKESVVQTSPPEKSNDVQAPVKEKVDEGMLCDLRKPSCPRPDNTNCPKPQVKKEEEVKKKKPPKKDKCASEANSVEAILGELEKPQSVLSLKTDWRKGSCKIKKFKFPECGHVPRRPQVDIQRDGCPAKPKKKKIIDCPAEGDDGKCKRAEGFIKEYFTQRKIDKDEKRCPKIDLTIRKKDDEDDDPCQKKRLGITKICPGDLLEKKRWKPKKKKTSNVTPPLNESPKKDQPQPLLTVKPPS